MRSQLIAQGLGQVGHGIPICYPMDVKPFEQLRDAIGRLAPSLELLAEFLSRLRFVVGRHETRLTHLPEEANARRTKEGTESKPPNRMNRNGFLPLWAEAFTFGQRYVFARTIASVDGNRIS